MGMLKRTIAWLLLLLLAFNFVGALISAVTKPDGSLLIGLITVGSLMVALGYWLYRNSSTRTNGALSAMETEARSWAELAESGQLPTVSATGIVLPRDEQAYLAEPSAIAEVTTRRRSAYAGTRISIGKMPLYFGGSESYSWKEIRPSDDGTIVLTNQALIFVGKVRTITIPVKQIAQVAPSLDSVTISSRGRSSPIVFTVHNPILWSAAIQSLAQAS